MSRSYLVRYGLARSVARFAVDPDSADDSLESSPLSRGEAVVVRTHRGTELGEVLAPAPPLPRAGGDDDPRGHVAPLLRRASAEDRTRAQVVEAMRPAHFAACQAVFQAGVWPIEVIDAEPLLDEGRTVLHYFGPHRLDAAGLVAIFRDRHGLDVVLEPVGLDVDEEEVADLDTDHEAADQGCGSCGSKSSGGCGSCATAGGCAVKALVAGRRQVQAPAQSIP